VGASPVGFAEHGRHGWCGVGWVLVEGNAKAQFDVPALDSHVFEDEAEQLLAAIEVQLVEAGEGPVGEVGDALCEMVVLGEIGSLGEQRLVLVMVASITAVELDGATGHIGGVDYPSLVEICKSASLGSCGVAPAFDSGKLGGEQFVVGGRLLGRYGRFAGGEKVGTSEELANLVEDECVEFIGSDTPLGAAAVLAAGTDRVVVRADVVTDPPVVGSGLVAGKSYAAVAAADKTSEQECVGLGPPGAEGAVIPGGLLNGLKGLLGDDGRDGNLNPFFLWPAGWSVAADGGFIAAMGPVPVEPAHIGFVAK
jgi:hypothetical protein